ncbi:fructosamine kinase family protein [Streptomyces flavalbus]|uniref:Fructosamine kinase family protein n=1 Tax=Streptomyces flavalbus TaxID=2665155 RepID=A0ABW2W0D6_9ACTN
MTAERAAEAAVDAVARLTGRRVEWRRGLSGAVLEAGLDDGRVAVVKRGDAPGAVRAEATGLAWLRDADAVRVPEVYGWDADWLVTERVPTGTPDGAAAVRFGRELAALHAAGAPAFGAGPPGGSVDAYIGRAPMRNEPGTADTAWADWYAGHRVLPYLRRAVDAAAVRSADAGVIEEVCARLPELAGPSEPPARLHGDLWNGNVLWAVDGRVRLIDPAAHGGHRETDLAMLRLFGCPHLDRIVAGYEEVRPLADGWRQRVGVHQLFPLLVHAVLFGGGYGRQAADAARAALAR